MRPGIVDTNIVRLAAEGDLDPSVVERLRESSGSLHFSPVSLLEIARHVRAGRAEDLARYQSALTIARELCGDRMLPLPPVLARRVLFDDDDPPADPPEFFLAWRDAIIETSSVGELGKAEIIDIDGVPHEVSFKPEVAEELLQKIEADWADDAERVSMAVLENLPDVRPDRSSGRLVIKGKAERERAREVLRSDEMKAVIAKALVLRLSADQAEMRASLANDSLVERAKATFDLFICYYLSLVEHRLTQPSGYNFEKRRHDRLDLELLLYVGAGYDLLTADEPMLHRSGLLPGGEFVRDPRIP